MNFSNIGMIAGVLALIAITIIFIVMVYIEPNRLIIKKYTVNVEEEIKECKIIFFSDTHFGKLYKQNKLTEIVEMINKQEADFIIFCGDFMDNFKRDENHLDLTYLENELNRIKANKGKYSIFGNHDYGGGAYGVYEELMTKGGFTVLKNKVHYSQENKLCIIGLDDQLLGDINENLLNIETGFFNIICCHEPAVVKQLVVKNSSIMISGHSHGGQVALPFIRPIILPSKVEKFIKGRYNRCGVNKNITLVVSCGIGTTYLPIRLSNTPEIVEITLKKDNI